MYDPYFVAAFAALVLLPEIWLGWKRHVEFLEEQDARTQRTAEGRALERRWRF